VAGDDHDNEDKTEDASAQRLTKAREDGRAPLSREVTGLAILVAGAATLSLQTPAAVRGTIQRLASILTEAHHLGVADAVKLAGYTFLVLALPLCVLAMLAAAGSVLIQTGFLVNLSAVAPDFGRVNPLAGLKRLFGTHNLMEAAKSLLKIGVVGAAGWSALKGVLPFLMASLGWTPGLLVEQLWVQIAGVMVAMLGAHGLLVGFDVMKTRYEFFSGLKMTRQEMRDEMKDADGDPHMKGKLKQMRMQRSRRRMMAAVPGATVVVTNPTHYAVALVYDRTGGGAPRIVAKGVDLMAARIREAAERAGVPLVANPPLARALYPLPLDREIPSEHFKAVAEIIAYIWRLRTPRTRPAA
jgi:flagellar biosynthetic protein FlhB